MSFTNQSLLGPAARDFQWVGLQNFRTIAGDSDFYDSLKITGMFVGGSALIGQFLLGLFLALYWDPRISGKKGGWVERVISTFMVTSWVLPPTVFAYCWRAFLSQGGTLNQLLCLFGSEPIRFLYELPILSIALINIARGTAWSWLLFSSSLNTIPTHLFQSADIDGASGWKKSIHIALPLIKGQLGINAVLITLWTFSVFDFIYAITGGGPLGKTRLISIYTYEMAFRHFELGRGAALALVVLAIDLVAAVIYLVLARRATKRGEVGT